MTNQHPITPPPDLLDRWNTLPCHLSTKEIFVMVARWGADQELEACCKWLQHDYPSIGANALRAARRPKPPSLKEQALEVVTGLEKRWDLQCDLALIRRALEALPND